MTDVTRYLPTDATATEDWADEIPFTGQASPTRTITLHSGEAVTVSAADYEYLSQFNWYALRTKHNIYARRSIPTGKRGSKQMLMHREVLGRKLGRSLGDGVYADHTDGDGLNNTRSNLRPATPAQNSRNRRSTGNTSAYKGVSYLTDRGQWRAFIKVNYTSIFLGLFDEETEAAKAYNAAAKKHHGEFAVINKMPAGGANSNGHTQKGLISNVDYSTSSKVFQEGNPSAGATIHAKHFNNR